MLDQNQPLTATTSVYSKTEDNIISKQAISVLKAYGKGVVTPSFSANP